MPPPLPEISLVIVTYDSAATLPACLAAVAAQTWRDFELIVVDNGPAPAPAPGPARAPGARWIANPQNLGFAAAANQGARAARGRWVAFLNPDAEPAPDWLEALIATAGLYPWARCFTSLQRQAKDPRRLDGAGDVMSATGFAYRGGQGRPAPGRIPAGEVFSPCGAAMMIDRELFLDLGGFDTRLFCYCEDVDLGYRLRLAGEPTLLAPAAVVRHLGSASSGGPRSDFAVFHGTRNRLWVFIKDTPPLIFWLTLPLHLLTTGVLLARQASRREGAAPWRGLRAALAGLPMAIRARAETQGARRCGSLAIARAMTWSPADLILRRVVVRPVSPGPWGGPRGRTGRARIGLWRTASAKAGGR